ncbi:Eco57I restriction-modification methylase domain-containing protein [Streptomyces odontomachi]|uniref:Eco57I restriction-modification methylase domain-containing protein n=1 Tax=Streptomyces odontomachi TaxID=2944940 RepID=UPI0021086C17|nr:type IIL restriction-modification enzyme MmeI [Streptomyces sp. ODS25]
MPPAAPRKKVLPPRGSVPTPAQQHEDWLRLLRPDGPFVSLPELVRAFPQGLDTIPKDIWTRLRQAWSEVQQDPALLRPAWDKLVLDELLEWRSPGLRGGAQLPESLRAGANTPDAVLLGPGESGPAPRVLLFRTQEWDASLTRPSGDHPGLVDRAADLCRAREVPLALLTNGREWALVHARPKEATTVAVFDADLWFEEPLLARAFASLLTARRAARPPLDAAGKPTDSTAGLFARTAEAQTEVTDTLGRQVREAVTLLVAEVSRLDRETHGALLRGVAAKEVYEGALAVMMRLVFLLYAEEQRLLPAGDELYDASYAVGPLHEELATARRLHGGELGDRTSATWPRLLAVFAAIHGGCTHDRLWIPPYGGSLFDPSRFPWLVPAKVTDRVVYEILDALLTLRSRKGFKGEERLSYKGLDVEQMGHVYEGLLEYGCRWTGDEAYVGLSFGRDKKYEAVLPLARLEEWAAAGTLAEGVAAASGTKPATVTAALAKSGTVTAELETACGSDAALIERAVAFSGLYGIDLRGEPKVWPEGSVVVVRSSNRRDTGTHYTPKPLAEEIVEHTLAPLCYAPGPAEGAERGVWRAKSADELLKLRVLDPAMGSGAFLVSACRYLSERVVEAWLRHGLPPEIARDVDRDDHEQLRQVARRLVADQCLYGVDRDPMAVELAKLSLWLVTLSKGRPFSFLDHALRCGDSLVGVLDMEQVKAFHLDSGARQLSQDVSRALEVTESLLSEAAELRRKIEATAVTDIRVVREKARLLGDAEKLSGKLRLAADAVVGAALAAEGISDEEATEITGVENVGGARGRAAHAEAKEDAKSAAYRERLESVAGLVATAMGEGAGAEGAEVRAREIVDGWLKGPRAAAIRPLHWPLEFPEIMGVGGEGGVGSGARGGFDAVVGNPPFVGGRMLTGAVGTDYREYLVNRIGNGVRGGADLCAYFLLRNLTLVPGKRSGIIATNSIAQNQTREVGLDQATVSGWSIYRAIKSRPWPGTAAIEVSLIWLGPYVADETLILDGNPVPGITSGLDPASRVSGKPYPLLENEDKSFQGAIVLGKGFVLSPESAHALITQDARNREVLFPYMNGEDLNSRPDCSASRWVINFHDWSEEQARQYSVVYEILEREVRPVRQRRNADGSYVLRKPLPERWWQYADKRPMLTRQMADLEEVIAIARVSKAVMPVRISTSQVISEQVVVFPNDSTAELGLLSSNIHLAWVLKWGSTHEARIRYTPADVYENFPRPEETSSLAAAGEVLEGNQRTAMCTYGIGLTKLYNLVHDKSKTAVDIQAIRDAHVEIDRTVMEAYGWADIDLQHSFRKTRQGSRFTIAPNAQTEILDRLLELNHVRHKEEVEQGLYTEEAKRRRAAARKARARAAAHNSQRTQERFDDGGLFPKPDTLF